MARVAVVSGGTRGIGAAVSRALAKAGYRVASVYAGNDEAAAKFKSETGIPVYNGMCRIMKPAPPASRRSGGTLGRSRFWSTMPASPAIRCFTR